MPPAANIEINGVASSNDNLPINTLVQLSNADVGGEVTYLWEILDQPEGTADTLSSAAIENPTFTPKKEGSYLIRLTVNAALTTVTSNLKVAAVRQLKTNERIPAAMETVEVDTAKGWKTAANRMLSVADDAARDANLIVCVNPGASFPTTGDIVQLTQTALIKTGLPGEERLLLCETALATAAANVAGTLGVVIGTPNGGGPIANGMVVVRRFGLVEVTEAGAPTVGDPVYVSDTAQPSLTAGTVTRVIGKVVFSAAGVWRWVIDGAVGALWTTNDTFGERTMITLPVVRYNSGSWALSGQGSLDSTAAGSMDIAIPMRVGDRLKEFTFSLLGDGAADLVTELYSIPNAGGAAVQIGPTVTTTNQPASYSDVTLTGGPTVAVATSAFLVSFLASATGLKIRGVRWKYDRI